MAKINRIKLDVFEGPLDLLLHLVKINEMDIYDIEIATITNQYLNYLTAMEEMDLEIAGEYMVMAATLLNIKSRSLLPKNEELEQLSDEEEIDEIFSTQELIRRLVEFRKFKELAGELKSREEENSRLFYRANVVPIVPGANEEMPRQDIRSLFDAFARVLKKKKTGPGEHTVYHEQFTVEEKTDELRTKLKAAKQINLSRAFESASSKQEVICYFLAILEMAKLREITLAQAGNFDDILIEPWDENVIYIG